MKKQPTEKLYKISEVAEILGVHEDTLRNWEKEGFVVPERIGTRKDRRYTAEMIGEIREKGLVSDLAKKSPANKKDLAEYTKDELIKELQLLKKQKKYGLVWEDHTEEVVERCKTEAPILVAQKDKQIKDKDKNKPTNILIEGDNYHALQVLNYTHKRKIDVIYIDPPYNTGNKDFVYNDHYVDKEDNFRHSKWISFMESRLRLARKLLKKNGVIFISIDDNEQAQLKLLCNGIFGEENFIASFMWKRKKEISNDSKNVSIQGEYILCYSKTEEMILFSESLSEKYINDSYNNPTKEFPLGKWRPVPLTVSMGLSGGGYSYIVQSPKGKKHERIWAYPENSFKKLLENKRVYFGKDKNGIPQRVMYDFESKGKPVTNYWNDIATNKEGKKEILELFNDNTFNTPKPTKLLKKILKLSAKKKSIILDFMAGSGTTGHAVLGLNKEDDGNRKFILCTNNELNGLEKELREKGLSEEEIEEHGICRRITHKRIEKVMKGYTTPNGEKVKGLGGSLEYFKTEFVDVENIDKVSDKKKLEFTYEAGQMIALKEDAFKEITKNKFYQIFTDEKDKFVGIYFRENLDKLAEMEKKILDKKDVKLYLFSYGVNDFKKDYTEYKNVTVKDIPEPILKIYKRLNN